MPGAAPSRTWVGTRQRAAQAAHASQPRQTKLELARELITLVADRASEHTVNVVADSAYAGRVLLEARPGNVHVISRLWLDAAPTWVVRAWYQQKVTPSFLGRLTTLRREGRRQAIAAPAWPARSPQNAGPAWCDAILAAA